jgi:acetylcholinesterase
MIPSDMFWTASLDSAQSILTSSKMVLLAACQRLVLASTLLSTLSAARSTSEVNLPGYGRFVGTTINQTLTKKPLAAPVDAWLGIGYASQPIGEGRFAHAGPPATFTGTKNATKYGFSCVQDPRFINLDQDEACLSMNVYRPQNISATEKLPVLIWVHGVSCLQDGRSWLD